ncbi:MAG: DbpA RNA binding domain-containing protein [Pirellulaceae bacterium]
MPTADEINAVRIERFKDQITAMTADQDLTMFKNLLNEYAEESGKPLDMIAAALAQIAQQGRPFLIKDRPKKEFGANASGQERGKRGGRERFDDESFDREQRPRRGGRSGRQLGNPDPGMVRYRIQVGWQDGVKPGNIVGAIANEAGLSGDCIGPIQINDRYSTIDLPNGMPSDVFHIIANAWVSGKQLRLRPKNRETTFPAVDRHAQELASGRGRVKLPVDETSSVTVESRSFPRLAEKRKVSARAKNGRPRHKPEQVERRVAECAVIRFKKCIRLFRTTHGKNVAWPKTGDSLQEMHKASFRATHGKNVAWPKAR